MQIVYLGGDPANHGGSGGGETGEVKGKEVHIEIVHELGTGVPSHWAKLA